MTSSLYDWPAIIAAVKRGGRLTFEDIAGALECDARTVRGWAHYGHCPKYDHGKWLESVYQKLVGGNIPILPGAVLPEPLVQSHRTGSAGRRG